MSLSKRQRFKILRRDGFACVYCGRRAPRVTLEVDHRIPRSKGGLDVPSNLVAACWDCNRGKGPIDATKGGNSKPETGRWPFEFQWEEHLSDVPEVWHADIVDYHSQLPPWMFPPRQRFHVNFNFDLLAAAAELAQPTEITIMRPDAVYEIASVFDPQSEVF